MLRVISGTLKGQRIETPEGRGTRPVLAGVRKAVFDVLQFAVPGTRILDLFGGSGSYAFEALSLGAASATIIEKDPQAYRILVRNARALGVEKQTECLRGDALEEIPTLSRRGRRYDLVFVAPPQGLGLVASTLARIMQYPLLSSSGLVVVQHHPKEYSEGLAKEGWVLAREKKYGQTIVGFYQSRSGPQRSRAE